MQFPIKRKAETYKTPAKKAKTASLLITPHKRTVTLADVHNLLLWILTDNQGKLPGWIFVPQKHSISKVLVLFLPGSDRTTWLETTGGLGLLSSLIVRSDLCTIVSPSEDDYLGKLVLQEQRARASKKKWRMVSEGLSPVDYEAYFLTEAQLRENMYELEGDVLEAEDGGADLVALDCEMVQTTQDRELARVSLVDFNGEVLYDAYVKPENPVTDYLTPFSGITAPDLETASSLATIRNDISAIISRQTIICGHSLENDLRALKLTHRRVIDTSVLYPHPQPSYKYSLKRLSFAFLNREIQTEGGHDSVEDAVAALDLVKLKVQYGPEFGSMKKDYSNLFVKLTNAGKKSIVVGLETPSQLLGGNVSVDHSGRFEKYLKSEVSLIVSKLDHDIEARLASLESLIDDTVVVMLISGSGNTEAVRECDLDRLTELKAKAGEWDSALELRLHQAETRLYQTFGVFFTNSQVWPNRGL